MSPGHWFTIQRIGHKYPDGIEVTDFLITYRAIENSNFEFSSYGHQSMMQFCTIFSDIFKVEKKSPDPRHVLGLFLAQTEVQLTMTMNCLEDLDSGLKKF